MQTGVGGFGGREAKPAQTEGDRSVPGVCGRCSSRSVGTGVSWLTLAERGAQAAGGRVNAGGDVGSKTTRRTKEWTATTERKHRARAVCSAAEVVPGCCSGWRVGGGGGEGGWCGGGDGLAIGVRNDGSRCWESDSTTATQWSLSRARTLSSEIAAR